MGHDKALFEKTIKNSRPGDFADAELSELVYIIARNNEDEALAEYLSRYTEWFMKLGELSLLLNEPEARWQFAIRLKEMTDKKRAGVLLEKFVNDDNEWECPNCGNKDHSKMNVTRRTCGYLGENFWNVGKTKEIKSRVLHL